MSVYLCFDERAASESLDDAICMEAFEAKTDEEAIAHAQKSQIACALFRKKGRRLLLVSHIQTKPEMTP